MPSSNSLSASAFGGANDFGNNLGVGSHQNQAFPPSSPGLNPAAGFHQDPAIPPGPSNIIQSPARQYQSTHVPVSPLTTVAAPSPQQIEQANIARQRQYNFDMATLATLRSIHHAEELEAEESMERQKAETARLVLQAEREKARAARSKARREDREGLVFMRNANAQKEHDHLSSIGVDASAPAEISMNMSRIEMEKALGGSTEGLPASQKKNPNPNYNGGNGGNGGSNGGDGGNGGDGDLSDDDDL